MTSEPRLVVSDVSHAYGDFVAARHVSLRAEAGRVHCLLGPSGSGKSTLLRLVAGLEHLQEGSISIAGREVAGPGVHVRPEERSVGFVFQDYALFPHLSVLRNVAFGMPRLPKAERRTAALELLERVGMEGYAEAMPHTLSGGQQQRVALARALAPRPGILLLDEPFSGLDTRLREEVRDTTLDLLRATGVATLMVTHDPREALHAGDVISVMRQGRIVQTGDPDTVYHRSASREVAEIFGPVNHLPGTVLDGAVSTVLGPVEAPDLADGTEVELLIRPESLRLERRPGPDRVPGTIRSRTLDGGTMLVHVHVPGKPGEGPGTDDVELLALALARRPWNPGDSLFLSLDPGSAMVHPR